MRQLVQEVGIRIILTFRPLNSRLFIGEPPRETEREVVNHLAPQNGQ